MHSKLESDSSPVPSSASASGRAPEKRWLHRLRFAVSIQSRSMRRRKGLKPGASLAMSRCTRDATPICSPDAAALGGGAEAAFAPEPMVSPAPRRAAELPPKPGPAPLARALPSLGVPIAATDAPPLLRGATCTGVIDGERLGRPGAGMRGGGGVGPGVARARRVPPSSAPEAASPPAAPKDPAELPRRDEAALRGMPMAESRALPAPAVACDRGDGVLAPGWGSGTAPKAATASGRPPPSEPGEAPIDRVA